MLIAKSLILKLIGWDLMSESKNRRKEPRHSEEIPLKIQGHDSNGKFFVAIALTHNVSLSGACVSLNRPVEVSQELQVFTCDNSLPNQTSAKACWVQHQNDTWLIGLHFERANKFWKNAGKFFNQLLLNQNLLLHA